MREEWFRHWLLVKRGLKVRTVGSRISNCKRVERYEGDLDSHYDADKLERLTDRLDPGRPRHKIPIDGDEYNGTATLRSAVNLYRTFRSESPGTRATTSR